MLHLLDAFSSALSSLALCSPVCFLIIWIISILHQQDKSLTPYGNIFHTAEHLTERNTF